MFIEIIQNVNAKAITYSVELSGVGLNRAGQCVARLSTVRLVSGADTYADLCVNAPANTGVDNSIYCKSAITR